MNSVKPNKGIVSKEFVIAIASGIAIILSITLKYFLQAYSEFSVWPLYAIFILGGIPLVVDLFRSAVHGKFGSDIIAGISIITSVVLQDYVAGAIVILMLSGGTVLEQFASGRAAAVLNALAKRMPRIAHRKNGQNIEDVDLDQILVGDKLVVFPHEICPVDGIVAEGNGSMDESYLTGEPFQLSKVPGATVFSGAVNGETALEIEVEKLPVDSRYTKIMRVMQAAEGNKPTLQRVGDRLGSWYTVIALASAIAAWLLSGEASRFLAVLVIATPCPLLIAIPVAVVGAISQAARQGIIVRNPAMLENISLCRTFIFDKTGTLTYGEPALTDILTSKQYSELQALNYAASLEQYSRHPLASTILKSAKAKGIALEEVTHISEKPGRGLQGTVGNKRIEITGRSKVQKMDDKTVSELPPASAGMECILLVDGKYAALFRFHDEPRSEGKAFIAHLVPSHDASKIILLSGDKKDEANYLAAKVGIKEVFFGKSPEDKVEIVRHETLAAPTLFVGDGINDAPAMQAATVSLAFGQNSDITAEAADAVVLDASLGKVDELIHIGHRMRTIALQSAVGGMGLSLLGMLLAGLGYLDPIQGAIAQEVIDVLAVLNALRVILPHENLRDKL